MVAMDSDDIIGFKDSGCITVAKKINMTSPWCSDTNDIIVVIDGTTVTMGSVDIVVMVTDDIIVG